MSVLQNMKNFKCKRKKQNEILYLVPEFREISTSRTPTTIGGIDVKIRLYSVRASSSNIVCKYSIIKKK